MDISINDLSFKGQFSDSELENFVDEICNIISNSHKLNGNMPVKRTKELKNRKLTSTLTIAEYISQCQGSGNSRLMTIVSRLLSNMVMGPFIDNNVLDEEFSSTTSICGEAINGTPLHAYISTQSKSIQAIISAKKTIYDEKTTIEIGKENHSITVLNFHNLNSINHLYRKYEPNQKHIIRKNKRVKGKFHTKMDLDDIQAQSCLDNGIQQLGSKYVYSFIQGKWYEFPRHTTGCYHGYPIDNPNRKSQENINNIIRIFGDPPYSKGYSFF